ncbi:hypothetical protein C8R44DRAFT_744467 [Mycena epipterygia]|nr:hypothetical protein C8R44DRAFT_744467 [Mycena epipterygia]
MWTPSCDSSLYATPRSIFSFLRKPQSLTPSLPLRRLSAESSYLFPSGRDFSHPLFTKITHLALYNSGSRGWNAWSGLAQLPCLTHLSVHNSPFYPAFCHEVLMHYMDIGSAPTSHKIICSSHISEARYVTIKALTEKTTLSSEETIIQQRIVMELVEELNHYPPRPKLDSVMDPRMPAPLRLFTQPIRDSGHSRLAYGTSSTSLSAPDEPQEQERAQPQASPSAAFHILSVEGPSVRPGTTLSFYLSRNAATASWHEYRLSHPSIVYRLSHSSGVYRLSIYPAPGDGTLRQRRNAGWEERSRSAGGNARERPAPTAQKHSSFAASEWGDADADTEERAHAEPRNTDSETEEPSHRAQESMPTPSGRTPTPGGKTGKWDIQHSEEAPPTSRQSSAARWEDPPPSAFTVLLHGRVPHKLSAHRTELRREGVKCRRAVLWRISRLRGLGSTRNTIIIGLQPIHHRPYIVVGSTWHEDSRCS